MKTSALKHSRTQLRLESAFTGVPTYEQIREYAYHLYEQNGRVPGHDLDNWLEAEACLTANIPRIHSRTRLHRHLRNADGA